MGRAPQGAGRKRPAQELRDHVRTYDAWYVAIAEALAAPLVTLDHRLANAHGLHCAVWTPATG